MNSDWSDMNKEMQSLIGKKSSFKDGIKKLIELRSVLFEQIVQIVNNYPEEAFYLMPFAGAQGYHSKTLAYSIWHIFRIEDIVAHELIAGDRQVLFEGNYIKKIGADIITTGNELKGEEIAEFSKKLDVGALSDYARDVMLSTNEILLGLEYQDTKKTFKDSNKQNLIESGCVSMKEDAVWLVDYWCGKDIGGLIKMPFSRHWIMHVEAMRRIKNRLCKTARKGVEPVAYCGFSCNHCFLSEYCGSCRTQYNICSFATLYPDHKCPNMTCCKEKGLEGCYECNELSQCSKGFYFETNDGAAAAKAQALYIKKYGKCEFLKLHDRLHQKYNFLKTQEILGEDVRSGLSFLENN